MGKTVASEVPLQVPAEGRDRRSERSWLAQWQPEDEAFWEGQGKRVAWRTLALTTFNLLLAFAAWFVVSASVVKLAGIGFQLTKSQEFWLTAMPGLAGGLLRMVWMFLPPVLGTRKLVTLTTGLLLIPIIGWSLT